jgi:hypothetical protein
MRASQKLGTAMPATENDVIPVSSQVLRFNAASMPSGMPMANTRNRAVAPSVALFLILSFANVAMSALLVSELPRSPVTKLPR